MKKRFTEQQIIGFLKEAEAGMPIKELCRKHGFSTDGLLLRALVTDCASGRPGLPFTLLTRRQEPFKQIGAV